MDWIEWLLSREFRQFVLQHDLFIPLLFVGRVLAMTAVEWVVPARKVPYRTLLAMDIVGAAVVGYLMLPAARYLSEKIVIYPLLPEAILTLPMALRFVVYYLVGDFGAYWVHRFLHLTPFWRMHKWHHSPTTMYWLAGYRTSFAQLVFFNLPWMFASSLFGMAPWWMYMLALSSHMLLNDWMHMNVTWRSNWLEWILVTPRYHHIHHSCDPAYYNSNFGVTFSVWDRLFGTYTDPDQVKEPLSFGIGEKVPLARLVTGV